MDQPNFITDYTTRKKGKHLTLDERGMIQALHEEKRSLRKIAAVLNCSPSTICLELKRGTPKRNGNRGRNPKYNAKRGQEVYEENRTRSKRHYIINAPEYKEFIEWVVSKVKKLHWSLDTCVGYAKKTGLFPNIRIPCTKTLYNMLHINRLPLSLFDLPEILSRKYSTSLVSQRTSAF